MTTAAHIAAVELLGRVRAEGTRVWLADDGRIAIRRADGQYDGALLAEVTALKPEVLFLLLLEHPCGACGEPTPEWLLRLCVVCQAHGIAREQQVSKGDHP